MEFVVFVFFVEVVSVYNALFLCGDIFLYG